MPAANAIPVQIKKLDPDAVVPEYKKPGDAGFDLHALRRVEIPAGHVAIVPTGLAFAIPEGFEMIEARWLFGIMPDNIEIVVHPQSIIHSMVAFKDGSVKAQLGLPDMHLPIRYALGLPDRRLASDCRKMTIEDMASLTLERPDFDKFPLLGTAYAAARKGGTAPCVMNAANEIAVAAFLQDKIKFTDIHKIIEQTMEQAPHMAHPTHEDYVASNADARARASRLVEKLQFNN